MFSKHIPVDPVQRQRTNTALADALRDPVVRASRVGTLPFQPRTQEQFRRDMIEASARRFGIFLRGVFLLLFLPFRIIGWIIANLSLLLAVWVTVYGLSIVGIVIFLAWRAF